MNVLLLTDSGLSFRSDYPSPVVQAGEALIRARAVGICATDLALLQGYKGGYRGVLGHEFVGDVIAAPTAPEWIGRRVVGEINIGCGDCALCERGLGKHCHARRTLGIINKDGAMADYFTLPVANLHEVPPTVSDEAAVFTEPLAAALEILEQVHIGPEMRVILIGSGKLGLLVAQILALTGCDLTVIGRNAETLALLESWKLCKTVLTATAEYDALPRYDADVVVEATGTPAGFLQAREFVRPGGTIILKSTFAGNAIPVDLNNMVVNEVTVLGSRCGPFAPALRLLEREQIQVLPMVQATYALHEGVAALEHAEQRGVLKILIRPDATAQADA